MSAGAFIRTLLELLAMAANKMIGTRVHPGRWRSVLVLLITFALYLTPFAIVIAYNRFKS
jgi:hypothetical protein